MKREITAFDNAFYNGRKPPYFVGIVTAQVQILKESKKVAGIVTQDLTNGKRLELIVPPNSEECFLLLKPGEEETRFMDPFHTTEMQRIDFERAKPYVMPDARIDL